MYDFATTPAEQRAIEWALSLAARPGATPAERELLARYQHGELSGAQVLVQLGGPMCHVLYCSQAVHPLSESQLHDLLEQARANNERHGITGLLCYENGHFVQLLEGPHSAVQQLYANIGRDRRHHHVHLLSGGTGPARWFGRWHMAFAKADTQDFYWLISYLEARQCQLVLPQVPVLEPSLQVILTAFSKTCTPSHPPLHAAE